MRGPSDKYHEQKDLKTPKSLNISRKGNRFSSGEEKKNSAMKQRKKRINDGDSSADSLVFKNNSETFQLCQCHVDPSQSQRDLVPVCLYSFIYNKVFVLTRYSDLKCEILLHISSLESSMSFIILVVPVKCPGILIPVFNSYASIHMVTISLRPNSSYQRHQIVQFQPHTQEQFLFPKK